ncbi:MAG: hypothetical protein Q8R92_03115 [Deltaproteobacteria bacterium]|nr:hypothetical protein [Deltaproteobacteria bacterium]
MMRPDVSDILSGIQRTLMEEILPDLASDRGRERLTSVLFLLQHCMARWDRVGGFLKEEHDDLSGVLERIAAARAAGEATGPLADILREIESAVATAPGNEAPDAIEELRASVRERRAMLASLLGRIVGADLPDGSALAHCRREAHGYVGRQINRDREWVQVGEIVW